MKQVFTTLIILALTLSVFGDTTTVSNYVTGSGIGAFNPGAWDIVTERFELPAPGTIEKIRVRLGGNSGTFQLHVYGHEGGIPWPEAQIELITPQTVNKPNNGGEWVEYTPTTPIDVPDDQFFIGISNLSAGVSLTEDKLVRTALCTSALGGDVWYQYYYDGVNWMNGTHSVLIEVLIDIPVTTSPAHFTDVTNSVGINTNFGQSRLAAADVDDDGWVDLLVNGQLYLNDINGTGQFIYSTNAKGLSPNAQATAFVDSDDDGDMDILALQFADNSSVLYENDGAGNFTANTLSNFPAFPAINSLSIADVNGDNLPDIHIGQLWVTYPDDLPKYLFLNQGGNSWTDNSNLLYTDTIYGVSRGSQFTDYNNDGLMDLYVANYVTVAGKTESPRDELWENNGNGTFTNVIGNSEIDNTAGTFFWNYSTGCHWADYDNDGDIDLLAATLSHPRNMTGANGEFTEGTTIYSNDGAPNYTFTDQEGSHGIHFEETHSGGVFGDINNDGLQDFFITAFYECRFADLYIQQADHSFELESFSWGVDDLDTEQDAVLLDYDNDGDLDLLAGQNNKVRLFRNDFSSQGNYVKIQPISTTKNHFAIGAKVTVWAGGDRYMREVIVGRGQRMQEPYMLHFGIGNHSSIDSVVIQWPGDANHRNKFTGIAINQSHTLQEFIDTTTGIDDLQLLADIKAYPNPASDNLYVSMGEINGPISFKVMNYMGAVVQEDQLLNAIDNSIYTLPLNELASGKYLLEVQESNSGKSRLVSFIKLP